MASGKGGRERTMEKQEELERFRNDPKNKHFLVCDLQALKEASLKCQTSVSAVKPDCTAQIHAYRDCLKAISAEQKKERDRVFYGKS